VGWSAGQSLSFDAHILLSPFRIEMNQHGKKMLCPFCALGLCEVLICPALILRKAGATS
jgi:hypothetical protein